MGGFSGRIEALMPLLKPEQPLERGAVVGLDGQRGGQIAQGSLGVSEVLVEHGGQPHMRLDLHVVRRRQGDHLVEAIDGLRPLPVARVEASANFISVGT